MSKTNSLSEMVQLLLGGGSDPNVADGEGWEYFHRYLAIDK